MELLPDFEEPPELADAPEVDDVPELDEAVGWEALETDPVARAEAVVAVEAVERTITPATARNSATESATTHRRIVCTRRRRASSRSATREAESALDLSRRGAGAPGRSRAEAVGGVMVTSIQLGTQAATRRASDMKLRAA